MLMRMDQLPNDVETLKRLVIEQASALYSERLLVEKLKLQIARLRRMQFGSSSERHGERIAQLELLVEAGLSDFLCVRRVETFPRRRASLATNARCGGKVGFHITLPAA